MRRGRRAPAGLVPAGLVLAGLGSVLAGCGGSDAVEPAPDAGAAACTALVGRLPAAVLDRSRTDLSVTGAAAWGDPAIVLRCGVPAAAPSDNPCLDLGGVGWVFTETKDEYRFVSYHRTPAVEVTVPAAIDRTTAPAALIDLADAVKPIPSDAPCN